MRKTILLGLAAATFVTVTSWANMNRRTTAYEGAVDVMAIQRSVTTAALPVAPVESYQAF